MTLTLNLPPEIERAYLAEAETRGLTLDELISAMLLSQSPRQGSPSQVHSAASASQFFQLEQEDGVPVLRTGQPIDPSVINDTLDGIRRERELSLIGTL